MSAPSPFPALSSSEGALVSVSIHAESRLLEEVLEALATVDFPINPQIYHDASVIFCYPDGREEEGSTTIIEFPAYEERLPEVRSALEVHGLDAGAVQVTGMLEEIYAGSSDSRRVRRFSVTEPGNHYPKARAAQS
jgi:hypothetical protein